MLLVVPGSYGAQAESRLREFNKCHDPETGEFCAVTGTPSPGKEPVGVTMSSFARHGGMIPESKYTEYMRNQLWYSFPKDGDYIAAKVAQHPIDGEVMRKVANAYHHEGSEGAAAYLLSLVPKLPPGFEPVFRIGRKGGGLAGKNAANARGLVDFIDLATEGGDYNLAWVLEGRWLSIYAVKARSTHGKYAATGQRH